MNKTGAGQYVNPEAVTHMTGLQFTPLMTRLRAWVALACISIGLGGVVVPACVLAQPVGASLTVRITGLHSGKGQVKIALFDTAESWLGDHPRYSMTLPVESQEVSWKLNDIPYGDYGIAVFHDENKNGRMDKNFLGIPQESYGFSNNMRVTLGPPSWERSKFSIKSPTASVSIEVK